MCYLAFTDIFARIAIDIPWLNFILKAFRHGDGMHLFDNMICLLWLGLCFEKKVGSLRFVGMFFAF